MQRKFITNLILLLFLNLLIKPFWILGVDLAVQKNVGVGNYGFYYAVFNFSFLFNIFLDMGITNFNNRNIAQNNHLLNKHFSSILLLKLMLGFSFIILTYIIGLLIGYNADQLKILGWMVFNQFLISFVLYLRSNISGLLLFKTDSLISVLDRFLMIIFTSILLWGNVTREAFKIEWFIYCQTAAYFVTAIIALLVVMRKSAFQKLHWNWPFFMMIVKKSFPYAVLVLLMTFYNRIDSVMIERILPENFGNEQVGIYASAYRLLDATNMIAYLFSVLLLPLFAHMISKREPVTDLVKLSFDLLFTVSVIIASICFTYSEFIMGMLYKTHIKESSEIFRLIMIGFIPISATYIFGTLLTANGNLKELNIVAGSGMILNITLNLILIPRLFAQGSAFSSLITQSLTAAIQVFIACKVFSFKFSNRFVSFHIFFVFLLMASLFFTHKFIGESIGSIIIAGIIGIILSIVFGLLPLTKVIEIVKARFISQNEQ